MNSEINQNAIAESDLNTRLTDRPETILIDLLSQEHFTNRHIPRAQVPVFFAYGSSVKECGWKHDGRDLLDGTNG